MNEKSKFSKLYLCLFAKYAAHLIRDPYGKHDVIRTGWRTIRVEYDMKRQVPTISFHKRIRVDGKLFWWYEKYAMIFSYGDVAENEIRVDRALKLSPIRSGKYPYGFSR